MRISYSGSKTDIDLPTDEHGPRSYPRHLVPSLRDSPAGGYVCIKVRKSPRESQFEGCWKSQKASSSRSQLLPSLPCSWQADSMSKALKTPRINVTRYRGQWLALHPATHKIIAHHQSLQAAKKAAVKRGIKQPIMYAVRKSDAYFVGRFGAC